MSNTPDFSKAKKAPMFNLPAGAGNAPGITGKMPLPPGKPMILKKVSPGERAVLERVGWKDGDPVPENLADVIADATAQANDIANMPPPVDMRTPTLKVPKEVDIATLPEAEQDRYAKIIDSLAEARQSYNNEQELDESFVENAPGSVNDAIRAAVTGSNDIKLDVTDDTKDAQYANGAKKAKPESELHKHHENCPHCGWLLANEDIVVPTEDDKMSYLITVLGMTAFSKEYLAFGGKLVVKLQTLTVDQLDLCYKQLTADTKNGRVTDMITQAETLGRYRLALQLVSLQGPGINFVNNYDINEAAENEDDTVLVKIQERLARTINLSASLHKTLMVYLTKFNTLVQKMDDNVTNENFWQAIN